MEGDKKRKGITVIVKPTHDCNLGCAYCYVDEKAERGFMSNATLRNTIEKIAEYNTPERTTEFIWHGGEPLLGGIDLFQKIVDIENSMGETYSFKNSLQTNGTLLNKNMALFFKERGFRLGFSLDGTKKYHELTRPFKDGKSSFDKVIAAITLAKEYHIGGGAITVITKKNIGSLKEIYQFFRSNKIHAKFNPLIKTGNASKNLEQLAITSVEYGKAMSELFEIWFNEKEYIISVDPFEQLMNNLMTGVPVGCNYTACCQDSFISIGPLGDAYPCGRFDGNGEFYLGNINVSSFEEIDEHPIRDLFRNRPHVEIKGCQKCDYLKICNSGCPHDAYFVTGNINTKSYYCAGYKILFRHIEQVLHKELAKAEVKVGDIALTNDCKIEEVKKNESTK